MKKQFISCIALLLIISILTITLGTGDTYFAQAETSATSTTKAGQSNSKEEVIYASLGTTGEVKQIYTVNILNITGKGQIRDYGSYSSVKNLTSLDEIKNNGDSVTFAAPAGRFYYQGNMADHNLPWNIEITYYLNHTKINPDALAGQNGHLEMRITTKKNTLIDAAFYDNYLLQIAITLDTDKCSNIAADGATLANAGTNKLITYTIMPGKEGNISLSTDVQDFEMEGIQISAIPFSMSFELPDTSGFTDDFLQLSDAIQQLSDGISSVKDGVLELDSGTDRLKNGSSEFMNGFKALDSKSDELVNASAQISGALSGISDMLSNASNGDLASLTELPAGLTGLASGLDEIASGLDELGTGFSDAYFALDAAIAGIPDNEIPQKDLQDLMMNNPDNEALNQLIDAYTASRKVKGTFQMVSPAFDAVNTNLDTMSDSIATISSTLNQIAAQLTGSLGDTDLTASILQLSSGIEELAKNYEAFHTGLSGYTSGVSELYAAYDDLDTGIAALSEGTGELCSGVGELNDGAKELNTQTSTMPDQINTAINDLLSDYDTSDYTPVSFVSKQNDNVTSVQFVLKTDKLEKVEVPNETEVKEEPENFWTRLKALFTNW